MAEFSLSKLPWKAQLGAFVMVALAGAGSFYYFYDVPAQDRLAAQEAELNQARMRLENGMATARKLPEFKREVTELQARLASLRQNLPEEKDAADLLRRVHTLAVQSNLTIKGFKPQTIASREMYVEWPISLELAGTYHDLGTFLDRVSKVPRIINVSGLTIEANSEPQPSNTIQVTCTATTFVLLDPSATEDAKGKKSPKKAA